MIKEEYLGDGLYVSFDGWAIWLRAPRENGDHKIALEPAVHVKLVEFIQRLKENKHKLTIDIESNWKGFCSCGKWKGTVSKNLDNTAKHIQDMHLQHVKEHTKWE